MKKMLLLNLLLIFVAFGCSKDKNNEEEEMEVDPNYVIVNNGGGGVSTTNDSNDATAPAIVQAVPDTANEQMEFSNTLPIILFFNDKLYLNSLAENIEVTQNGSLIGGIVTINEGANGFAIMTFSPSETFTAGAEILFNLKEGVQDDGGNVLGFDYNLSFTTKSGAASNFDGNENFENGTQGVEFIGDGAIMNGPQGCIAPVSGSSFAVITSGDQLVSGNSAIADASSVMILGPISNSFTSFSFQYNFLSSEFQEFVGSEFDDSVVVTAVGPNGAYSKFLTSVNTIGLDNNTQCMDFPGMPDDGDVYAGATGWLNTSATIGNIGSPAYIIFTITDVADTAYSSLIAVENITY